MRLFFLYMDCTQDMDDSESAAHSYPILNYIVLINSRATILLSLSMAIKSSKLGA